MLLGTVDSSGYYSKVAFRHGFKSNVGFSEYYNLNSTTAPTYYVGADKVGQFNGLTGVNYVDSNSSIATFNAGSSYVGFDDSSKKYVTLHSYTSNSATQGVAVIIGRNYTQLTSTSWSVLAGNKLMMLQNGNSSNSYTTQFLIEGNGSIRSLGGMQLGFTFLDGYMGGASTDVVRTAIKGIGATSSTVNLWLVNSSGTIANNTSTTGALMKVFDDGTTEHYGVAKTAYGLSTPTSLGTAGWVYVGGTNTNNIVADTSLAGAGYISPITASALGTDKNKIVGTYNFVSSGGAPTNGDITVSFAGTNVFTSTGLNTTTQNSFTIIVTIYRVNSSSVRVVVNYIGNSTLSGLLGNTSITDIGGLTLTNVNNIVITSTNGGGTTTTLKSAFEQWLY